MNPLHRRQFIQRLGLSAASLPFIIGLPSLGLPAARRGLLKTIKVFI